MYNKQYIMEEQKPKGILFSVLAYNTDEEYQTFLTKVKEGSEAEIILTINAALRHAQSKGAFSFEESEVIINALRIFSLENGETKSN
jgi:hypothetical protein